MPLPSPEFGQDNVWDGTTPRSRPTTDIFKNADGEIGNRHSSEIIALEELLKDVVDAIEILKTLGDANSLLGVNDGQDSLEYKTLIQGTGITITHVDDTIVFTATGGGGDIEIDSTAGEAVTIGDALYIAANGKAYKAQANAAATSRVIGCSNTVASADEAIKIVTDIAVTKVGWGLVVGDTYYLSPYTAGDITSVPPTITGHYLVPVGIANTATQLAINLQSRILL